jgi:hypothetical protein
MITLLLAIGADEETGSCSEEAASGGGRSANLAQAAPSKPPPPEELPSSRTFRSPLQHWEGSNRRIAQQGRNLRKRRGNQELRFETSTG